MIAKFKSFLFFILCVLCDSSSFALTNNQSASTKESVYNTEFYKNIAVQSFLLKKNEGVTGYKITINAIEPTPNSEKNVTQQATSTPILGKLLWTITPEQFSVSEDLCNKHDIELCDETLGESCYKSCLTYGPQSIKFDEKNKKLYMAVGTPTVGTTGIGPYFVFVADINKKSITLVTSTPIGRPDEISLSPSAKYLLAATSNGINIINTTNGETIKVSEENNWQAGHERLHSLGNMKWLNENQFSYQDAVSHDESQNSFDEMKEYIYDIPTKKIIRSRTMDKSEYEKA